MKENNQDLNRLLQQWRDIEPAGNFEANVWRKIRLAQPTPARTSFLISWLPRPAFALAVAVGVIVGAWSGMLSVPAHPAEQLGFLGQHTLAGSLRR